MIFEQPKLDLIMEERRRTKRGGEMEARKERWEEV